MKLADVATWRYQLQNVDVGVLQRERFDLLVVDRAGEDGDWPRPVVERMKVGPGDSRRLVLCYWSIGEAESYRAYWRPEWKANPPPWLGKENPEWKGNYAARFWMPGWQGIVLADLAKIVEQGFDGVYLDKVDEFEDLGHASDMKAFVGNIAAVARQLSNGFLIVPQNGDSLLVDPLYRLAIDGIAREDLLYGEGGDGEPNDPDDVRAGASNLSRLKSDGKTVLAVEYAPVPEDTLSRLAAWGFVGLVATRDLDR